MDLTRFTQDLNSFAAVLHQLPKDCAGITSASCLDEAVGAATHALHRTIADFKEAWNKRKLHFLPALPSEILVACFEGLQHRDRLAASRVSRAVRAVLLGTPECWSTIYRPSGMADALAVCRLQNMVRRSGNALLDVNWGLVAVAEIKDAALRRAALELLVESMPRIRSLEISGDDVGAVLTAPAPCLRSLTISNGRTVATIPARWIHDNAPALRSLFMCAFFLPRELPPLQHIEAFRGMFPLQGGIEARALFQLFPGLKSLNLADIGDASQLPETAPPTLSEIVLRSRCDVDFAPVLANWTPYPIHAARKLHFCTAGSMALQAALEHLAVVQPSPTPHVCIIGARDDMDVTLSTPAQYIIKLQATQRRPLVFVWEGWAALAGSGALATIRALTVADNMLLSMLRARLALPGLAELTILASANGSLNIAHSLHPPGLMRMPRLRTLAVEIVGHPPRHYAGTLERLSEFVNRCLLRGEGKLESVTIVQQNRPAWESVSGLLVHSHKLYYCTSLGSPDQREEIEPPEGTKEPPGLWDGEVLHALAALFD